MTESDDPKRTWSAWVNHWLTVRFGPGWTQTQFRDASNGELNQKTISKWVTAQAAASAELAIIAARILNAPVADAMRAAGFPLVAEELAKTSPGATVDPGIQEILDADLLTDEEKASYIKMYQADLTLAAVRARELRRAVEDSRRNLAS